MPLPPVMLMTYSLDTGGSERQATAMAISLSRRGWPVYFGCLRARGPFLADLREAGIPVVEFPVASFASPGVLAMIARLRGYIRRNGIQIIHTFDAPSRLLGVPAGRLARAAAVFTSHRGSYAFLESNGAILRLTRWMDRWADGAVANCAAMAEELRNIGGLSASRVHLNYNGIDADLFSPGTPSHHHSPDDLGSDHHRVIGSVAMLRAEKDFMTLVDAFHDIHRDFPATRLLLVGGGPEREPLLRRIAERNLSEWARIEPPTRDVANWLRCLDVFVLPSLREAFSNSLMEAMSCGRCCIASRVGGNPELIEHGRNGLLFEPGDPNDLVRQLRRVLADPTFAAQLAQAARASIQNKFSIDASASRLEAIYRARLA